jgi:DNA-binding XRE family transcriptional regulator
MTGGQSDRLSDDSLLEEYFTNLHGAHASMTAAFEVRTRDGLTQDRIADRLGVDKALISRRLTGEDNLTLKTLSFMATAMSCRLAIIFQKYEDVIGNNYYSFHISHDNIGNAGSISTAVNMPVSTEARGNATWSSL